MFKPGLGKTCGFFCGEKTVLGLDMLSVQFICSVADLENNCDCCNSNVSIAQRLIYSNNQQRLKGISKDRRIPLNSSIYNI